MVPVIQPIEKKAITSTIGSKSLKLPSMALNSAIITVIDRPPMIISIKPVVKQPTPFELLFNEYWFLTDDALMRLKLS